MTVGYMSNRTRIDHSVISLDNNFLPLQKIGRQQAIKAIAKGRAYIVDLQTWEKSSEITQFVEFKAIIYPYTTIPTNIKMRTGTMGRGIFKRDGYVCQYDDCRNKATTIDHIIPRAQGGTTVWQNLVSCCRNCNQYKGNRTPEQAGMKLKHPIKHAKFLLYEEFHREVLAAQEAAS
jgi:hypothetical protein